jgi:hypothetical protein
MDKENIHYGNIILGVAILGFGLLRMITDKKSFASLNHVSLFAAVFLIVIGLIGLKYLKK